MRTKDFWGAVASTYSYLSIMWLREIEAEDEIRFVWRPFNIRQIMTEMKTGSREFLGRQRS